MSIGRRFANLVRSNLTALFERDADDGRQFRVRIEDLSDAELEAELRRRRGRREAAERAASEDIGGAAREEAERAVHEGAGRFRTTGGRRSGYRTAAGHRPPSGGQPAAGRDARLAQLYAQLECPYGADLNTLRRHYRALMRKYHPDVHAGSPEKLAVATELSQRLTMAYNDLRRALRGPV